MSPRKTAPAVALLLALAAPLLGGEPPPTPEDVDRAVAAVADYDAGKPRRPLFQVEEIIRRCAGQPETRTHLRRRLAELLRQDVSHECKLFVCQQLWVLGSAEAAATLQEMLLDDETVHMACYALGLDPAPQAARALRAALAQAKGTALLTLVNHLGERRDEASVEPIRKLVASKDATLAAAALTTLGKIASAPAAEALQQARRNVPAALRPVAEGAALQCAQRLAADGKSEAARALYRELRDSAQGRHVRRGALLGLIRASGPDAVPLIASAFRGDDARMKAAAIASIRELEGEDVGQRFAAELSACPPDVQVLLIHALVARGDGGILPALTAATRADAPAVRVAALEGLGQVGDASSVPALVRGVQGATEQEARAALNSLRRLGGEGVDAALIKAVRAASGRACAALIKALHDRGAADAVPALLEKAAGDDPEVRQAAFRALGRLAPPEHLPRLVGLLGRLEGDAGRKDAELAVAAVARRMDDAGKRTDAVLAALGQARTAAARASLLRVLGHLGGAQALEAVRGALDHADPQVRDVAVRTLADWPSPAALGALRGLLRTTTHETHRAIALRGCVRLLRADPDRPGEDAAAVYADLLKSARGAAERKLLLSGLARVQHPAALPLVQACLEDPAVRAEAELALMSVARGIAGGYPEATRAALDPFVAAASNADLKAEARQLLAKLDHLGDFLAAWQVAGPYHRTGATAEQLFDVPFPPEEPGAEADWQPLPLGPDPRRPWVFDLQGALGGEQRLAYVRTWVRCPAERPARLEVGSDDGHKVWLNGAVVLANNVAGACTPGQYKADVTLRKGWNALRLKVTQFTGPWQVCARLVRPDGGRLEGLRVRPTPPPAEK